MTINYLPFSFHLERYHLRFGKQNQRIEQIPSIKTAIDMWNVCGILSYENVCWFNESGGTSEKCCSHSYWTKSRKIVTAARVACKWLKWGTTENWKDRENGWMENIYLSRLLLIAFYCIESRIDSVTWHENFRLDTLRWQRMNRAD